LGITSLVGRLVDKEFRRRLKSTFYRKQETTKLVQVPSSLVSANPSLNYSTKFTLFESLHLKVHNRQFILDSLIALSFYLARNAIFPQEGAKPEDSESKLSEEVFSIEADIIKEALQTNQLNDFFNECES
jgi:hypothetical protein